MPSCREIDPLFAPFKGGTLVPFPHLLNGPFPLTASGSLTLGGNWLLRA